MDQQVEGKYNSLIEEDHYCVTRHLHTIKTL